MEQLSEMDIRILDQIFKKTIFLKEKIEEQNDASVFKYFQEVDFKQMSKILENSHKKGFMIIKPEELADIGIFLSMLTWFKEMFDKLPIELLLQINQKLINIYNNEENRVDINNN